MKLTDSDQNYQEFSAKASEQTRQLSLAAIGIVWIFKTDIGMGRYVIPSELKLAAFFAILALGFDFLQYAYASILWGIFHKVKEKELGRGSQKDFGIRPFWNIPTKICFYCKLPIMVIAWAIVLHHIAKAIG